VGGLIEKSLAARRAGLEVMLLPRSNEKDIAELPEEVREGLELVLVDSMDQVLERALERKVEPRSAAPPPAAKPQEEGPAEYAH
jgi:ATP-dependent Lon protease